MARRKPTQDPALVVGYVRVSGREQHLSPVAQKDEIRRWCMANERALVHISEDVVTGDADLVKRPGLLEAIAALREHGAGVLLVTRIDRLSRDVPKAAMVAKVIEDEGARVLSCDGVGNEHTPEARLMRNMVTAFAAYEKEIIGFRTKIALAAKKSRGQRHNCRAPYGYRWTADDQIERHPAEQLAVERICFLRSEGMTLDQVVDLMNKSPKFKPRGSCWHRTTVHRIDCRKSD